MKLFVQPEAGVAPIVAAIRSARRSIDLTIFRFDRPDIEDALEAAAARGVTVRALIGHGAHRRASTRRKLEARLSAAGVQVDRTARDLVRYHDKMIIVDRRALYLLGFNFTRLDMEVSRSFALYTRDRRLVREAQRVFNADLSRRRYGSLLGILVVSPENSRERLAKFLRQARRELLIYDHKLSDPAMIRILLERAKSGVKVRIIGRIGRKGAPLKAQALPRRRLHLRAIIRDGRDAFVGSQSLRTVELDARREVGVFVRDPKVVRQMMGVFETDWATTELGRREARRHRATQAAKGSPRRPWRTKPAGRSRRATSGVRIADSAASRRRSRRQAKVTVRWQARHSKR